MEGKVVNGLNVLTPQPARTEALIGSCVIRERISEKGVCSRRLETFLPEYENHDLS